MHARIDNSLRSPASPARTCGARKQPQIGAAALKVLTALATWQDRWRQRRMLETMDEKSLRDLGLSGADVFRETSKPFWQR